MNRTDVTLDLAIINRLDKAAFVQLLGGVFELTACGLRIGEFELVFHIAAYFPGHRHDLPVPAFLARVPLRFGIADTTARYRVPLLCRPSGYSTYRDS